MIIREFNSTGERINESPRDVSKIKSQNPIIIAHSAILFLWDARLAENISLMLFINNKSSLVQFNRINFMKIKCKLTNSNDNLQDVFFAIF